MPVTLYLLSAGTLSKHPFFVKTLTPKQLLKEALCRSYMGGLGLPPSVDHLNILPLGWSSST